MIKEHRWKRIYENSDVEQCEDCPVQRRQDAACGWQYRATGATGPGPWVASSGTTAPDCGDAGAAWFKFGGYPADQMRSTESLESEFKAISERIATDPQRFQAVRNELRRRREARDEQPPMEVTTIESQRRAGEDLGRSLVLKITEMEAEQAKLVVEAELFRSQRDEAVARLALVARTAWKPMTREVAAGLILSHMAKLFDAGDRNAMVVITPPAWAIDAVVEASSPPNK